MFIGFISLHSYSSVVCSKLVGDRFWWCEKAREHSTDTRDENFLAIGSIKQSAGSMGVHRVARAPPSRRRKIHWWSAVQRVQSLSVRSRLPTSVSAVHYWMILRLFSTQHFPIEVVYDMMPICDSKSDKYCNYRTVCSCYSRYKRRSNRGEFAGVTARVAMPGALLGG